MADQKDQHPDSPAEDPTFLPLEKRAMAEKSLPGYKRAPESKSKSDSDSESSESGDDDDEANRFSEKFKKKKLEELKRKALYSVLHAFRAESSTISNKRTLIIEKLMKELNISHETHTAFEDSIQKNLVAQQQRVGSSAPYEKAEASSLAISEKKETPVRPSGSSWGSVNPESLVGKWVRIRIPGGDFQDFLIKEYDAEQDMHGLENGDENAMEMDDMLICLDVREIPPEDIMWEGGQKPNFGPPGFS